jgi:hypothetical protein
MMLRRTGLHLMLLLQLAGPLLCGCQLRLEALCARQRALSDRQATARLRGISLRPGRSRRLCGLC